MSHRITRAACSITRAVRRLAAALAEQLRRAWGRHARLLRDNPAYAAAAAAGAASVAGQDNGPDLIAALAAWLLAAYAATRRSVTRW